jgi:hypothetical protein
MAEVEKFTGGVMMLEKHYDRLLKNDSNKDIDPDKSHLNYSIPMDHGGLSPNEYYQKLVGDRYVYGRGTKREEKAITACAWVITAPAEIADDQEKVKAFLHGCYDFCANRYHPENIIHNSCHFDEGGRPHIHILFCPSTSLDPDRLHYSTQKVAKPVRLESGRYEYSYRFKLDKNGERIPLKNYSKMADYYDEKISAADVLNKFELQHFHGDLQTYLDEHGIEGQVLNGATSGGNISVKSLKEFTQCTGLTIDDLKENPLPREELENKLEDTKISHADRKTIELINQTALTTQLEKSVKEKDTLISNLNEKLDKALLENREKDSLQSKDTERLSDYKSALADKDLQLSLSLSENQELKSQITDIESRNDVLRNQLQLVEDKLKSQQEELKKAHEKIADLESKQRSIEEIKSQQPTREWGNTSEWGKSSGWGNRDNTREETKS